MENKKITLDKAPDKIDINLEKKENELESKSYNELKEIAKEKGLVFAKNITKKELIKLINDEKKVNAISLDNKPVSPIVLTNDKEEIPAGFIFTHNKSKRDEINFYNGRAYKVIGNGYAIWCDNGQSFLINSLK